MAATEPGQVIHVFTALYNKGDLDALIAETYEESAVFYPTATDEPHSGHAALRPFLGEFVDLGGTVTILSSRTAQYGDIALTQSRWRLEIAGGDPMENVSAEIVRKQPDGTWKYAIDNPWGALVLDS